MNDQSTRIYFGTDKVGQQLRKTYGLIAARHYGGSISKMFREAANEKWGVDPETGELRGSMASHLGGASLAADKSPRLPTGSPKAEKARRIRNQD
jgi:hypothetical protein